MPPPDLARKTVNLAVRSDDKPTVTAAQLGAFLALFDATYTRIVNRFSFETGDFSLEAFEPIVAFASGRQGMPTGPQMRAIDDALDFVKSVIGMEAFNYSGENEPPRQGLVRDLSISGILPGSLEIQSISMNSPLSAVVRNAAFSALIVATGGKFQSPAGSIELPPLWTGLHYLIELYHGRDLDSTPPAGTEPRPPTQSQLEWKPPEQPD